MFQMKFYAVALLRSRGVLPARLRLIYLADGQLLDYTPDLDELLRFEKTLDGDLAGHPIRRGHRRFPAARRPGCATWCAHQRSARRSAARRRRIRAGRSEVGGVTDCYYRRSAAARGRSRSSSPPIDRSNWDPSIQHGSPPLALLTKLIEEQAAARLAHRPADAGHPRRRSRSRRCRCGPGWSGPARGSRCGRRDDGQRPDGSHAVAGLPHGAGAHRYRRRRPRPLSPARRGRDRAEPARLVGRPGYLDTRGCGSAATMPARGVWLTPLVSLVDDDDVTEMQRLAMVVDSANGVGAALDPDEFLFMNTDTAVHLHRCRGRGLRAAGARIDRPRRYRCDHRRDLRPSRLHRHVGADAAGAAALNDRSSRCQPSPVRFTPWTPGISNPA